MEPLEWPDNLWQDIIDGPWPWWSQPKEDDSHPVLYQQNLEAVLADALKERYQKALHLRYEQGMTYREIGEIIGTNAEGTRQIIVKALRILREPKNFFRLHAVPEIEVVRVQTQLRKLLEQHKELEVRFEELFGQAEKEKADKRQQMPSSSTLDDLGLSVRSRNVLLANRIETVGQLMEKSVKELENMRHLGKKSAKDIVTRLAEHGYELRQE